MDLTVADFGAESCLASFGLASETFGPAFVAVAGASGLASEACLVRASFAEPVEAVGLAFEAVDVAGACDLASEASLVQASFAEPVEALGFAFEALEVAGVSGLAFVAWSVVVEAFGLAFEACLVQA